MDTDPGWQLETATLREVLTDPDLLAAGDRAERRLAEAPPLQRLTFLRLLGRLDEARTLVSSLLEQPEAGDLWPILLAAADVYADSNDAPGSARLRAAAWRQARSRERQAVSLHAFAVRDLHRDELEAAAVKLQLALALQRGFADPGDVSRTTRTLSVIRGQLGYDAIVLAGGRGERLGGRDKPGLKLGGWPLLDHVLLACSSADRRIVVGPARRALTEAHYRREEPAGSGPLAGIDAGAELVHQPLVVVLAADVPFIAPALPALRSALLAGTADAAVLIDPTGRTGYLAAMWRTASLTGALRALPELADRPVRALYQQASIVHVDDFDGWSTDCDTWADLESATQRLRPRSRELLPEVPLAWPRLELFSPS